MTRVWEWLSQRFFSLRWKTAGLLTLMVLLTALALLWPVQKISVERVLEHELVDLADETSLIAQQLRMDLLQAKDQVTTQLDLHCRTGRRIAGRAIGEFLADS